MIKKTYIFLFLLIFIVPLKAEETFPSYGLKTSKIEIKVFSSLTCPYCAEFHIKFLPEIINKYVTSQKVFIQLMDYPLDLKALRAAQIQKCLPLDIQKNYLDEIYKTQSKWSSAKTLKQLEANLEKISSPLGLSEKDFKDCLINKKKENIVLQNRINAQSKYDIKSTPTFVVNEKKFKGSINELEKYIKKLL